MKSRQRSNRTRLKVRGDLTVPNTELNWSQLVDLLRELHESREFLKPVRLGINSRYDKEGKLDLSLRVSTIAWAPPVKKRKKGRRR